MKCWCTPTEWYLEYLNAKLLYERGELDESCRFIVMNRPPFMSYENWIEDVIYES